jgi:tetratricopeptide (TPR) repeat protein
MPCCARWVGRPASVLAVVLYAALLVTPAPSTAESAEEAYRRGVLAEDAREFQQVADAMRSALLLRPTSGGARIKIYGMRFEEYTPFFRLGRALEALGDCPNALAAWLKASAESLRADQQRQLEDGRERCLRSQPEPTKLPVDEVPGQSPGKSEGASPTNRDAETLEVPPPPLGNQDPVRVPQTQVAPAPSEPPSWLRQAAAELLRGRYRRTVELLSDLAKANDKERSTALVLRSAANFALARQSGSAANLRQARADASAARRLAPELSPSPFYFSEAFRSFFIGSSP